MSDIRLICGDCLEVMPTLEANGADAVVTDPPYGVDIAKWDDAPDQRFIDECMRIASGAVVLFGGASMRSVTEFVKLGPQRMAVWAPKFTLSHTAANGMFFRFHPIWMWRLPTRCGVKWDVLDDNTECGNWWKHKCTKPLSLMEKIVQLAPVGATILDPFMGSGTTGVACVNTGRNFIGIEIDPGYFAIAEQRIAVARAQLALPLDVTFETV